MYYVNIDGRFRIAAIATALLHFPNSSIFLHDYQKYEERVSHIADFIQHCDGLFRIMRKESIPNKFLQNVAKEFANNPN